MHVTSPHYPLAASAAYKPSLHSLSQAMSFESRIRIPNIVLVQPSIYGTDNSCLLDALNEIGPQHGRGVVTFDCDNITPEQLQQWHSCGVRGVRLNFKSNKTEFKPDKVKKTLSRYAEVVRPLDWVVELFIDLEQLALLGDFVPSLGVKVCIAHFGAPDMKRWNSYPKEAGDVPGMRHLLAMLSQTENLWIKFSAHYRYDRNIDQMEGTEAIAKLLLGTAKDKMVFASDWPHTRFEGLDVKPFVERCLDWTEGYNAKDLVFRDNAKKLWNAA